MTLNTQIHKPRSSEVERESETTTEVAAQKAVEGCKGERESQKHQQQGNDAHNVDGTKKKIETCKAASKKSEATESTKSETQTLNNTLEIERTATSTSTRP